METEYIYIYGQILALIPAQRLALIPAQMLHQNPGTFINQCWNYWYILLYEGCAVTEFELNVIYKLYDM